MKLSEVKAGSGARAGDDLKRICSRCQADIGTGLTICPECGARLDDAHEVEPMSTTFDAELARANLLRMRGEYKPAADLCLSILKRFPNSLAAHTLLGDIYSDQGQLEQSAQWYELALDLDPGSSADRQKLEDVRAQIQEREHISSVEQLGLPEKRKTQPGKAGLGLVVALCLVVVMVFAFRGKMGNAGEPAVIRTPIQAIDESGARADGLVASKPAASSTTDVGAQSEPAPPPSDSSYEDRNLMQQVGQQSTLGVHLISVFQDPRNKLVTLTYKSGLQDDERRIGAMLAKVVLDLTPSVDTVTIRSMKNDRLSYTADVPRSRLLETENPDWKAKAASPDAWISYVLTKEWPLATTESAGDGTTGDVGGVDQTPPPTSSGSSATGTSSAAGSTTANSNGLADPTKFTGAGIPKT